MRTGTAAGVRSRGFTPGGRQDRHIARWLVRRVHLRSALHRLGGLRRQPGTGYRGRPFRSAHLDGIHKTRGAVARYSDAKPFDAPDGVVTTTIDPESGMPAPQCPKQKPEVFIAGTEPVGSARCTGTRRQTMFGMGHAPPNHLQPAPTVPRLCLKPARPPAAVIITTVRTSAASPSKTSRRPPQRSRKKKGIFGKLKDIFR